MLTKRQVALATGATTKWVENTSRALGRPVARTEAEARWLGLVREFSHALGVRLEFAAEFATRAMRHDSASPATTIASSSCGALGIALDLERFHSRFGVALAAACLDKPCRPGPPTPVFPRWARTRPAILVGAAARGVDLAQVRALAFASPARRIALLGHGMHRLLTDLTRAKVRHVVVGQVAAVARGAPHAQPMLDVCCPADGEAVPRIARLLAEWKAWPLGISHEYPFVPDLGVIADAPVLALETTAGAIVLNRVTEQEFANLVDTSDLLDLGEIRVRVLRVGALIASLRARQRTVPVTAIPELEAAAVVLNPLD